MILYTMMPYELVFPNEADDFHKQKMVTYNGVPLLVEHLDAQTLQVVRVLSSNPMDFLDDRCCPGSKISLFNTEGLSAYE